MKNVKKNYNLILGGAITAVMLLLILTGFFWTPYDPESMEADQWKEYSEIIQTNSAELIQLVNDEIGRASCRERV